MKTIKAAIIGAGKIGVSFDNPKSEHILSHAHGYSNDPNFELVGIVDEDFALAEAAAAVWSTKAYKTIEELFDNEDVDVVSICTSTHSHFKVLEQLEQYKNIQGGIIEKPLANTLDDALKIKESNFYRERKFIINYKRRFLPEFIHVRENIVNNVYGNLINGTVYYGRGLQNNASHALDILSYLGCEITGVEYVKKKPSLGIEDFDCEAILRSSQGGTLHVASIPSNRYKVFEIDLFFDRARLKIQDEGFPIVEYSVKEDDLFKGYYIPVETATFPSCANKIMSFVVDNLYQVLVAEAKPLCTIDDGYKVQELCSKIISMSS